MKTTLFFSLIFKATKGQYDCLTKFLGREEEKYRLSVLLYGKAHVGYLRGYFLFLIANSVLRDMREIEWRSYLVLQ